MPHPLLIVDGDNLSHRAYHSTPKTVTGTGGQTINAIVGFFGMLANLYQREKPRGVFVCWDTLGVDTYRNELWPPYQGGRVFDKEIVQQLNLLPEICRAFGFGVGKEAGFEADDLMASATAAELERGGTCLLYTTDKDSYQLVSDRVTVLAPKKGSQEPDRIGPHQVVERMGVLPEQVPAFKALSGDSSDVIPGAKGIGPKGASALLLKHGTLEAVLAEWGRPGDSEQVRMFLEVVTMRPEVQVTLPEGPPDWRAGAEALRVVGAERMAERVAGLT